MKLTLLTVTAINVPFSIGKPVKTETLTAKCLTEEHGSGRNKQLIAQSMSDMRKRHRARR
jgi:hypothetical protein